jgi:hypothetical protein
MKIRCLAISGILLRALRELRVSTEYSRIIPASNGGIRPPAYAKAVAGWVDGLA